MKINTRVCHNRAFTAFSVSALLALTLSVGCSPSPEEITISSLADKSRLHTIRNADGDWGIRLERIDLGDFGTEFPVFIELLKDEQRYTGRSGYQQVERMADGGLSATATVQVENAPFEVSDRWTVAADTIRLEREVKPLSDTGDAFLSGFKLLAETSVSRDDVGFFAPGSIYGGTANLTPNAIGGIDTYTTGSGETWIREDRLPAPLFGIRFEDGGSVAVFNARPNGATTVEDSMDREISTLVSDRFRFGALGASLRENRVTFGYLYPGTEGEVTYEGGEFPFGQQNQWRRRYHPVSRNTGHQYTLEITVGHHDSFEAFSRAAWRRAWKILDPVLEFHDIDIARRALTDKLAGNVIQADGRTGMPHVINTLPGRPIRNTRALMGFTGKSIESANFLIRESFERQGSEAKEFREKGESIINSFIEIVGVSPPQADGFDIRTGELVMPNRRPDTLYLRSFSDGFKSLMQAFERDKRHGIDHPEWKRWAIEFGEWLLTQQYEDGGFPRSWHPGTETIVEPSSTSSYNPIPFLVALSRITGEAKYLDAAIRAGEHTWNVSQRGGKVFIGGTIDNPDVIDKEAGTLSLEAYIALFEETQEDKWLQRAVRAADFSETWIYLWNLPMPEGTTNDDLHWKHGVSTVGVQLISSGHSLVDQYMAFDADEFAKLYRYTGDSHYLEVARLLLHNTKTMLALPGREYDVRGPGWQQEHWSLAPFRGIGRTRSWLPWVTASHLNGIFGIMDFDRDLYQQLTTPEPH